MGIFSWLLGTGTSKIIEATGTAVSKVYRTVKGDKGEEAAAIADEQLATLASHAAEFAERGTRTKLDSVIDFVNRLPRPLIVFWALSFLIIPYFYPAAFVEYVFSLRMIPDELWTLILSVFAFFLGSRIISQDIRKPKMGEEEKKAAIEIIREREQVILENRTPLIVEQPATRKPPPPPWAVDIIIKKPLPPIKPHPEAPPIKGVSHDVDRMISDILKKEGGFVNLKEDSGGPTNRGITIATLSDWRETECTVDDLKNLTEEEAREIFKKNYFFGPSIDSIQPSMQPHVFDCVVNMGARGGIRLLQQAINALGGSIKTDGILGPVTREHCAQCDFKQLNNMLVDMRIRFYEELAAKRPKDKKFLTGWKKRANSFRVAA